MNNVNVVWHPEHDANAKTAAVLCADHLKTAVSCLMVDVVNEPTISPCTVCVELVLQAL